MKEDKEIIESRLKAQRGRAAKAREIGKIKRELFREKMEREKGETFIKSSEKTRCSSCGISHQDTILRDVSKLPGPWFGVDHLIDNYDDAIRLDKILFFSANYDKCNVVYLRLVMEGGIEQKVTLSYYGYDCFIAELEKFWVKRNEKTN